MLDNIANPPRVRLVTTARHSGANDNDKHLRISSLTSGKSSKLDVSSIDLTWTGMAAGRSLMCSQSTPRKNPIVDRSSSMPRPLEPSRRSDSQQNLVMASRASSLIGTSAGKLNVSRQFITFLYVSCGFSLQNGGYPVDKKKSILCFILQS